MGCKGTKGQQLLSLLTIFYLGLYITLVRKKCGYLILGFTPSMSTRKNKYTPLVFFRRHLAPVSLRTYMITIVYFDWRFAVSMNP